MSNPRQKNSAEGSGSQVTELTSRVNRQRKILKCSAYDIAGPRRELQKKGLTLRDTSGKTQCDALPRMLRYVGNRSIHTIEKIGFGFYRIATRVQEFEALGCLIDSQRERVVGADGLQHIGVARNVLRGFLLMRIDPQGSLDLGAVS